MVLNCIAVDDEPLALGLVCSFIEQTPFLKLVGRFSSGITALLFLHEQSVDLIFLDIQMPDLTGMQMARLLEKPTSGNAPRVIFTTAFNNYALEGYKVDALDYLLKPFDYEEFLKAAHKGRAYAELLSSVNNPAATILESHDEEFIFLKVEYQLLKVAVKDILYIEGLKDYVKVYLEGQSKPVLTLTTLKAMEERLPVKNFLRVHRSYIVALDKISSVAKNSLNIGTLSVTVGEQYREAFNEWLKKWIY
ncbi:LytTR family DNA-binding domain-containing protein [Pedobacter sp. MC2016-14]|uniref:LytR/AlgR family response regulator transcription factor n=1 Tax=Pedobacter sp. MC2016-14 TaxID=2897327 RepID=UPI001E5BF7DB|nr:LytTR family DNA-binding domain-containing protein [Pedobacter sp. MC2016-14]MCD0487655.1 LytTR family DNA-binding domain-containing protein [Pedobacter sp. MC2016-14]